MKQNLRFIFMALLCAVSSFAWGQDPTVLFHESFGDNSGSARAWSDSYSEKSGVPAVYEGITSYTVTNAKQSKNNNGSYKSGLAQSSSGVDASIIIGPLNVADYSSIQLSYKWKAGSIKGTYTTSAYYSTSSTGTYQELSDGTGTPTAASEFVTRSYSSLPETAQVATLYIKIVFNTSNSQAVIDEVELTGISGPVLPKAEIPSFDPDGSVTYTSEQEVTITGEDGSTIYYTTNGQDPDPTNQNSLYSEPILITHTGTVLKAIAVVTGKANSLIASATYTIVPESPTLSQVNNQIVITAAEGLTIYYTQDESAPSNNSNNSELYEGPISLTETVIIKAIAYDQYGNASEVSSKKFVVTPYAKNIGTNYFVKVTDVRELENGDAILIVNEEKKKAMSTTQSNNNRPETDVVISDDNIINSISDAVQKIVLVKTSDNYYYFFTGEGYLYAASSSSNYLRTKDVRDANAKAEILFENGNGLIAFQGDNSRNKIKYNSQNKIFSCYESGQLDVQIYKEIEPIEDVTITFNSQAAGYGTLYYGDRNLAVPTGVKAYAYQIDADLKGTKLTPSYSVIPAGVAVLLELESKETSDFSQSYTFTVSDNPDSEVEDNMLRGTDVKQMIPAEAGTKFYKLTTKDGENAGFYYGAAEGAPFENGAHKAYLAAPSSNASSFVFDDTNIIHSVIAADNADSQIYTISGVRINGDNLPAGLYIVNGKKMIIK